MSSKWGLRFIADWAHAPGVFFLFFSFFGLMVAMFRAEQNAVRLPSATVATWFIFIWIPMLMLMPPSPSPPPNFNAPSSWHSNWNANSDECAHVARLGSVLFLFLVLVLVLVQPERMLASPRPTDERHRHPTTFYGKWAINPCAFQSQNRKYTCAYVQIHICLSTNVYNNPYIHCHQIHNKYTYVKYTNVFLRFHVLNIRCIIIYIPSLNAL